AHLDKNPSAIRTSVSEEFFPKRDPRSGGCIYIWTLGANKTAHTVARDFGHDTVLALLMERTPPALKLAVACGLGDPALVTRLLAGHPALVSALTDDELRRLPMAAQNNNTKGVRLMLESGWPVATVDRQGVSALHWACWHGNAEMAREI